jgi:DNA-binding MarR family transcriptional regulator
VRTEIDRTGRTDERSGDPLALERQVCFALVVAARNVVALYRPLLEPMGLTHPQYLVMLALWQRAPLSVKELSGQLQLDPGTLSPLLKRLQSQGLLRRERDSDDERLLSVTLTQQGTALRARAELIPGAVMERLGMSTAELEQLHGTLAAFRTAAELANGAAK